MQKTGPNIAETVCLTIAKGVLLTVLLVVPPLNAATPPCDSTWIWDGALGNQLATAPEHVIADVNGTVFVVGYAGPNPPGLAGWNPATGWRLYAQGFPGGGIAAMAASGNYLYIAGNFQGFYDAWYNYIPAGSVARLHVPTATWTVIGTGTPNSRPVSAITVDSTGGIYIGLDTLAPSIGLNIGMLAKWNPSTSTWDLVGGGLRFDPWTDQSSPKAPKSMTPGVTALTAVGTDVYVGGYFIGYGPATPPSISSHVVKWSGSSQSWVPVATVTNWCWRTAGQSPYIASILVNGGRVYVTGDITPPGGWAGSPHGLAEFPVTGGGVISGPEDNLWITHIRDSEGLPLPGFGYGLCVRDCAVYVAGWFDAIGSTDGMSGVTAWSIGKQISGTWAPVCGGVSLNGSQGAQIYSIASDASNIYINGWFNMAGNVVANYMARYYPQGVIVPPPD